jgi:hypothetical protein
MLLILFISFLTHQVTGQQQVRDKETNILRGRETSGRSRVGPKATRALTLGVVRKIFYTPVFFYDPAQVDSWPKKIATQFTYNTPPHV